MLGVAGRDLDREQARAAELDALVDRDRGGDLDEAELAQVAAERGGGGPGGRVLDDAAGRERVARAERRRRRAVHELHRGPVARGHQRAEAVEVVVEVGERRAGGDGDDGVLGARVGDARRERRVEVAVGPAQAASSPARSASASGGAAAAGR